jgi:hypothetical protein
MRGVALLERVKDPVVMLHRFRRTEKYRDPNTVIGREAFAPGAIEVQRMEDSITASAASEQPAAESNEAVAIVILPASIERSSKDTE